MRDHYQDPAPWPEVPEPVNPSTPDVEDPFRDDDDDFDYEGHHNRQPALAAASIARPDLEEEISLFGVGDLRGGQLDPKLVAAMEHFRNIADQYETERAPSLSVQYDRAEEVASIAALEAIHRSGLGQNEFNRAVEIAASGGAARHVDDGRRTAPATPLFDRALKANQEEMAKEAQRSSAGRVRAFLEKIRTKGKKNVHGPDVSDSARSLEQAKDRGLRRGW